MYACTRYVRDLFNSVFISLRTYALTHFLLVSFFLFVSILQSRTGEVVTAYLRALEGDGHLIPYRLLSDNGVPDGLV